MACSKEKQFGLISTNKLSAPRCIPLKSVHLDVNSRGVVARIDALLVYQNESSCPLEVEYVMPMDSRSMVSALRARLGGREVRGEVRRREEARDEYDEAITNGYTAMLGEQVGKDLFRILLGNLSSGEIAELRVCLLQEMDREEEEGEEGPLRFSLPITLKPRYSSVDSICGGVYELSLAMNLRYEGGLSRVESPSHKILANVLELGVWQVQMIDPNPLKRDFVVLLYPNHPSVPSLIWGRHCEIAMSQKHIDGANETHPFAVSNALMLNFLPQFSREDLEGDVSCEIIFVIDRSGSMKGEAIASARVTLELLLRSLSPGCAFNVVGFGSNFGFLFPEGSRSYDRDSLQRAVVYAHEMQANLGGTEILSPLQHVFSCALLAGLPRQVLLLTDGAVSNIAQVVSCVRENSSRARTFAIGIGSGVSSELVRGVAGAGRGRAVFVMEWERMQSKILKLLSDVMCPCFTDVELKGPDSVSLFSRNQLQLFSADCLVVYGLVEPGVSLQDRKIVLSYKHREKQFSHEVSLDCTDQENMEGDWIHRLACNAVLREWEQEPSEGNECCQLSCDTNIVCSSTALVGVECGREAPVEGTMQYIRLSPPQLTNRKCVSKFAKSKPTQLIIKSGKHGRAKQVCIGDIDSYLNPTGPYSITNKNTVALSPHEQLISHQTAEGYWEYSKTLTQLLRLSNRWRDMCPKGMKERELITILCLQALESRYLEFEDEWKFVAKKAWRWLRGSQSAVIIEQAFERVKMEVK